MTQDTEDKANPFIPKFLLLLVFYQSNRNPNYARRWREKFCIGYFLIAVVKCHDQRNIEKKSSFELIVLEE